MYNFQSKNHLSTPYRIVLYIATLVFLYLCLYFLGYFINLEIIQQKVPKNDTYSYYPICGFMGVCALGIAFGILSFGYAIFNHYINKIIK